MPAHWLLGKAGQMAWIAVCRGTVGPEEHVVPQQWLTQTPAPGVMASDRRRLNYGASLQGLALCCDATVVSPFASAGMLRPRAEHSVGLAFLAPQVADALSMALTVPSTVHCPGQAASWWREENFCIEDVARFPSSPVVVTGLLRADVGVLGAGGGIPSAKQEGARDNS